MNKQLIGLVAIAAASALAGCASQNTNRPMPGSDQGDMGHVYGPQPGPSAPSQGPANDQQNMPAGQPAGPNQPGSAQPQVKTPPKQASQVSSPAVMSLLSSADALANAGHMDASASTLERALDIEPRNPFIYQRLAAVRLAQGQGAQAEQIAMKSNSVAGDNPLVESGNWRLIAEARSTSGDDRGASQASSRAVNLRDAASQYGQ